MGFAALAAVMAILDVLLGIVPRAAARSHRDSDEKARDDHAEQQCTQCLEGIGLARNGFDDEIDDDRREHRQQRRDHHLLDRRLGDEIHRAGVIGLGRARHDARIVAELTAHFLDHRARRPADRGHPHRAKQIRHQRTEQQPDDDVRIAERKGQCLG